MGQASGHQKIMPQSSKVPEHPSSAGKGAGEHGSLARGWEEDLDAAVSGLARWASSPPLVLVSPATSWAPWLERLLPSQPQLCLSTQQSKTLSVNSVPLLSGRASCSSAAPLMS